MKARTSLPESSRVAADVGGDPAREVLDALVHQFTERSAFVRELVQNALDAEAGRIDVEIRELPEGLRITVADDGHGMGRETIEKDLVVLFRSSKENDLTRIGKFGIGFVSIFAVAPEAVVVDTSRDGVHHRIIFDSKRDYTLAEVDDPFEGTAVCLHIAITGSKARELIHEVQSAVHYWCRFARARIFVTLPGSPPALIQHPFDIPVPFQVEIDEEGLHAVLGYSQESPPFTAYHHRGLTLLETRESMIPGLSFRVESALLEHTLTRDNVVRDQNHARVIGRLAELEKNRLRPDFFAALEASARSDDPARHEALLSVARSCGLRLPLDLPVLRCIDGPPMTLADVKPGILGFRRKRIAAAHESDDGTRSLLLQSVLAHGDRVLALRAGSDTVQKMLASLGAGPPFDIDTHVVCPALTDTPPLLEATSRLCSRHGFPPFHAALFAGRGEALKDRLAWRQLEPGKPTWADAPSEGEVLVATDHPLFARLALLNPRHAALLLLHAVTRDLGDTEPAPETLLSLLEGAR